MRMPEYNRKYETIQFAIVSRLFSSTAVIWVQSTWRVHSVLLYIIPAEQVKYHGYYMQLWNRYYIGYGRKNWSTERTRNKSNGCGT